MTIPSFTTLAPVLAYVISQSCLKMQPCLESVVTSTDVDVRGSLAPA